MASNFGLGTLKAFTSDDEKKKSLHEEARQAYQEQKLEKKAIAITSKPESPEAATGAAEAAKSPFPKPKRAAVWKSGDGGAKPAASPRAAGGSLSATDISALQANLQQSVTSSVRESLQATLHAELAEVKRQLRMAEETAGLERKHAETRHSTLIMKMETTKALSDDASSAAHASENAHAKALQSQVKLAIERAEEALSGKLEVEAAKRDLDLQLQRLTHDHKREAERTKEEHERAIKAQGEEAARKLREAAAAAEKKLLEESDQHEAERAAAHKEAAAEMAAAERWAEEAMARQIVDVDALAQEVRALEVEKGDVASLLSSAEAKGRQEGEAAAEKRLEDRIAASSDVAKEYESQMGQLERASKELEDAKAALSAKEGEVQAEREAAQKEVEQYKQLARSQLAAERDQLVADMEALRYAAGREAAVESLQRESASLLAEREALAAQRLELDAATLTMSREAANTRAEISNAEAEQERAKLTISAELARLEKEREAVGKLLERDRQEYADALQRERASAAAAAAEVEKSHSEAMTALRGQLAAATSSTEQSVANALEAHSLKVSTEGEMVKVLSDLQFAKEAKDVSEKELNEARVQMEALEVKTAAAVEELAERQRYGDAREHALASTVGKEVRILEGELRRAREAEAAARHAQEHSELLYQSTIEQLTADAKGAKTLADERIKIVEAEALWQRENLGRQLEEARGALEVASSSLVAEQSAVFALRGMLLAADADVAAMRGAAAHYAALGGEEAGSLRSALSKAEVSKREAVEAERRRSDALLEREREHFDSALLRLRESSFGAQAKLSAQLEWMSDAMEERTRQLTAEREGFEKALENEREATQQAKDQVRKVLAEVAERQAARHAQEMSEQGAAMEAQLGVERETFLQQLVEHKGLTNALADSRAEARAAKLELIAAKENLEAERKAWAEEKAALRNDFGEERKQLRDELAAEKSELEQSHKVKMEDVREEVDAEKRRLRLANDALEAQIAGLTSALERERITHARECERMEERQRELEQKVHHERLHEVRQSTSALEAQLIDAQKNEEALRSRLRSLAASAQAEVEKGTGQISELHDARQRQLRMEHTQLAELHAQTGTALKSMADQREALEHEAAAHRRTQQQLLELHETMQKEREAFALEMSHDRDARAQLPIVLAELASTQKMLDSVAKDAGEKAMLGRDTPSIVLSSPNAKGTPYGPAGATSPPVFPGLSPSQPKMPAPGGWSNPFGMGSEYK